MSLSASRITAVVFDVERFNWVEVDPESVIMGSERIFDWKYTAGCDWHIFDVHQVSRANDGADNLAYFSARTVPLTIPPTYQTVEIEQKAKGRGLTSGTSTSASALFYSSSRNILYVGASDPTRIITYGSPIGGSRIKSVRGHYNIDRFHWIHSFAIRTGGSIQEYPVAYILGKEESNSENYYLAGVTLKDGPSRLSQDSEFRHLMPSNPSSVTVDPHALYAWVPCDPHTVRRVHLKDGVLVDPDIALDGYSPFGPVFIQGRGGKLFAAFALKGGNVQCIPVEGDIENEKFTIPCAEPSELVEGDIGKLWAFSSDGRILTEIDVVNKCVVQSGSLKNFPGVPHCARFESR
ncbi:hypothetical protein ACH4GK_33390 [Streptomyces rimosus]|uniref:hypothetical protein n=1 Tax=Streptomyces rimosus TaxID=1927 RepID=UPI00131CF15F|nr:hypothetical protein [Streptomyces rimosus]